MEKPELVAVAGSSLMKWTESLGINLPLVPLLLSIHQLIVLLQALKCKYQRNTSMRKMEIWTFWAIVHKTMTLITIINSNKPSTCTQKAT